MQKKLEINTYTQINTNNSSFLIQNLSKYDINIIVSESEPTKDDAYDFLIKPFHGLGNNNIIGILWGKPSSNVPTMVGLIEG